MTPALTYLTRTDCRTLGTAHITPRYHKFQQTHCNELRCGFQPNSAHRNFPDSLGSSVMREPIASVSAARARSGSPRNPSSRCSTISR
jgi:hypothetical protein